jgi:hypothetical protein
VSTYDIKNIGNKLISVALKAARKKLPWYSFLRYLPLGYARVSSASTIPNNVVGLCSQGILVGDAAT